jgi:hypothetical protein
LDPTIISLLTKTAGQVRYHGFLTFSSFFILFHPFSSLFFKKKGRKRQKKAGTGRDTSFALENLKPDKKSFTKKANLFETKNGNLLSWSSLPVHV